MRKLLLSCLAVSALAFGASAVEQTINITAAKLTGLGSSYSKGAYADPESGLSFAVHATTQNKNIQLGANSKAGNWFAVTANTNNYMIKDVTFNGINTSSGKETVLTVKSDFDAYNNLDGSITGSNPVSGETVLNYQVSNTAVNKTATVDAPYFVAYNSTNGGQIVITSIDVTYDDEQSSDLKSPELGVVEASLVKFEGASLTTIKPEELFTNPNGLDVKYGTSNSDVAAWNDYFDAFIFMKPGSVTLTASFAGNDEYRRQTVEVFVTVGKDVENIQGFLALEDGILGRFKNSETIVYLSGRYMFLQDSTGSLQLYNGEDYDLDYQPGQNISGFQAVRGAFANNPQGNTASTISTFPATASGDAGDVAPSVVEGADLTSADYNRYVRLNEVTVAKVENKWMVGDIQLYNRFGLDYETTLTDGAKYNVIGFYVISNTTPEIFVTEIIPEGQEEKPAAPEVTIGGQEFAGSNYEIAYGGTVTVNLAAEGFRTYYKWTPEGAAPQVLRIAATDDFVEYTAPLSIDAAGELQYYAKGETLTSDIKTINFTVGEKPGTISLTPAPGEYHEWPRVDGKLQDINIRVAGATYIGRSMGITQEPILRMTCPDLDQPEFRNTSSNGGTKDNPKDNITIPDSGAVFTQAGEYSVIVKFNVNQVYSGWNETGGAVYFTENPLPAYVAFYSIQTAVGVEDVVAEEAAIEYYDLNGRRVNGNLVPGVYVKRQGEKVTKVVIK